MMLGTSRGIQCSCMSPISVSWTLFKSPGLWNKLHLDCILSKVDQLFKFIGKFRYLEVEDLPQEFMIENCSIRNYSWGIFVIYCINCKLCSANWDWCSTYCNNYIFGLIWGTDSIYLFHSYSKDEYGKFINLRYSSSSKVWLLKFTRKLYCFTTVLSPILFKCNL